MSLLLVLSLALSFNPSIQQASVADGKAWAPNMRTLKTSIPITCNSRLGGVAAAPDGSIYISNFISEVWRRHPNGETTLLASNLRGSSGNTIFHGDLLQSSFQDNQIRRITPKGEQSVFASSGLQGPIGLAANKLDEVFVCNFQNNSIVRIDPDGSVESLAQGGHLNGPNGISIGPESLPYIVNYNDNKVLRLRASGELELFVRLPGAGNAHIAWAQNAFYVTKIADNTLYKISLEGKVTLFTGTGKAGLKDGALDKATLNAPNGIATTWDGKGLVMNNMLGTWKSKQPAELILRQIDLLQPAPPHPTPTKKAKPQTAK